MPACLSALLFVHPSTVQKPFGERCLIPCCAGSASGNALIALNRANGVLLNEALLWSREHICHPCSSLSFLFI